MTPGKLCGYACSSLVVEECGLRPSKLPYSPKYIHDSRRGMSEIRSRSLNNINQKVTSFCSVIASYRFLRAEIRGSVWVSGKPHLNLFYAYPFICRWYIKIQSLSLSTHIWARCRISIHRLRYLEVRVSDLASPDSSLTSSPAIVPAS